ncbi:MAG: hypothetical protein QXO30_05565 [Candidatus Caldarchaeum sp.]
MRRRFGESRTRGTTSGFFPYASQYYLKMDVGVFVKLVKGFLAFYTTHSLIIIGTRI